MVLADVLAREGNLGEYLLPEFGLLTQEQIADSENFGGNAYHDMRRGRFVHAGSSEAALANKRRNAEWKRSNGYDDGPGGDTEPPAFRTVVAGMPGEQKFLGGLRVGQVAVIFGNTFTVDIVNDPVEITPPGFPERTRRAVRAAEALRAKGVDACPFMYTVGACHDTVTVVGVAVPVESLPVETVGLLRNNRNKYGVREADMDADSVSAEYRAGLEATLSQPLSFPLTTFDLLHSILEAELPDAQALASATEKRNRYAAEYRHEVTEIHGQFFPKR